MVENRSKRLDRFTFTYFQSFDISWKIYPINKIPHGKQGRLIKYLNFNEDQEELANKFHIELKKSGFDVKLLKAGRKPSIVVDLTSH